jgi:group I intron endonuclease
MFIIYKHTNRSNGKVYVGYTKFTLDERWKQHCKDARLGSDFAFHRAIRKHGLDVWDHCVIEECIDLSEEQVGAREMYWIAELAATTDKHGYNMTHGGLSRLTVWTEEMREFHRVRTSEGTKLAFQDPEIKKRHQVATKIASNKPKNRKRNSDAQKIAQNKPDTKVKHAASIKRAWENELPTLIARRKLIEQLDLVTKVVIATFRSAREAARELGLSQGSISNVARGLTKSAGGFLWRYVVA